MYSQGRHLAVLIALGCALLPILAPRASGATAQSPPGWSRPAVACPFCAKPPRIDGVLDDDCWKTALHAPSFFRLTSPVSQQTEAWVCADKTHLYVAFHCYDNEPGAVKASETQRNGNTWLDDYVSVDIDSQDDQHAYSQFIVTARGTQNENLEGGTADNITWAGDWIAATKRTSDGWTAEISIPFALLRYPRGAHAFGFQLERKLARETTSEFWPDRPAVSQTDPVMYFAALTGLDPTFYRPQPIYLPYVLAASGKGNSLKEGLDVKYPLTSGITGLATIHPDFGTVEQNVTNINFSYTAHFISDQRPFFAEGSGYFPYSDVFYSPSVGNIDQGIKVTGKEGQTALALMETSESGPRFQYTRLLSVQRDLNALSNVEVDYAGNNQAGLACGQVVKTQAQYGWMAGRDQWLLQTTHTGSWLAGVEQGEQEFEQIAYNGPPGHPSYTWQYSGISPSFVSELGFIPQINFRGPLYSVSQYNTFDRGYVQTYQTSVQYQRQSYWNGGFFYESVNANLYANTHTGNGIYMGFNEDKRMDYRDHYNELYFEWSDRSHSGQGNIDYQAGTQEDQSYRWWSVNQGYGIQKKINMWFSENFQVLGATATKQIVFTPQYLLTSERSLGGRIVVENDQTDIYLSYAQKSRTGSDIYLLFGDPNSPTTRGLVEMKIVSPF
jgi:hypothetical protein